MLPTHPTISRQLRVLSPPFYDIIPMLKSTLFAKLSSHARQSLKEAVQVALSAGAPVIEPKHLLLAIILEKGSIGGLILRNAGLTEDALRSVCFPPASNDTGEDTPPQGHRRNRKPVRQSGNPALSSALRSAITRAFSLASELRYPYVGSEHIMYAIIEKPDHDVRTALATARIDTAKVNALLRTNFGFPTLSNLSQMFDFSDVSVAERPVETEPDSATPYLDQYGIDLMEEESDPSMGRLQFRGREVERMIHILGRRTKNNPLLIGEPGVGKTTLVHALAQRILMGTAGPLLADKRIIGIDLALVVAGTNFRGEFESRLKEIIHEASENSDVILFIDEIHTIVGAGNASGSLDAANILKPALSRGEIQCIGATTFAEHKRHIEKDPALERRFQPVLVAEPTPDEAVHILSESRKQYEDFHAVSLPNETLRAAVDTSVRYISDRFLPDKAFDLLDEAASAVRQTHAGQNRTYSVIRSLEKQLAKQNRLKENLVSEALYDQAIRLKSEVDRLSNEIATLRKAADQEVRGTRIIITPDDIARVASRATGIPYEKLSLQPGETVATLEEALSQRIIGQSSILKDLSTSIVRSWSGVSAPHRPLGSFLFLGPSGVGKTLTAKVLAEVLFGSDKSLIRLDMSEFGERHTVAQMIGAPAGYVGYGEGGKLTEQIRRQPYSVVLFDEIEKAHPDAFNVLLQILDEGYLTDAEGRRVNFRNTIVILTSNIGTQAFNRSARLGFHHQANGTDTSIPDFTAVRNDVLEEVRRQLRPELLNRLDRIAVFEPLTPEAIRSIITLELRRLRDRLTKQKVSLTFPKNLDTWLLPKIDQKGGARFVRNAIETHIETPIAFALLNTARPTRLAVRINGDTFSCHAIQTSATAPKPLVKRTLKKKAVGSKKPKHSSS